MVLWDKKAKRPRPTHRGQSDRTEQSDVDVLNFFIRGYKVIAIFRTHTSTSTLSSYFTLETLFTFVICLSSAFADGQSIASSAAWTCSTSSVLPSHERSRRHDVTIDESRGRGARTRGASPLRPGPPRRRVGARGAKLNRSAPKTARWRARREVQSIGAAAAARSCSTSAVSSAVPTSSSRAPSSARLVCTSARSSSR